MVAAALVWALRRDPDNKSVEIVAVPPRAIAVLPFDNLSHDASDEELALGVADSVLHQLASIPELIVVARSSSFSLGRPTPAAREAGRRLGVRYLVEGSVQRMGRTVRVTAQLIDADASRTLWSVKLDRAADAVFELQDQIADQVARELDVTLHGRPSEYARYGADAYLAFVRGRALVDSRTLVGVEESIKQFSRAVELSPSFAAAITELAWARVLRIDLQNDGQGEPDRQFKEIEQLVDRAIAIDPNAGEPYFMRAHYRYDVEHDATGAEADFRKGYELAPSFGPGLQWYADYLVVRGRSDEALAAIERARQVDPLGAENHYRKAEILRTGGTNLESAVALYLEAITVAPDFYPAYARLGQVRAVQGRFADAIRYAEKAVAIEPKVSWPRDRLLWFYLDIGELAAARDVLRGYVAPAPARVAANEAMLCMRAGNEDLAARRALAALQDDSVSSDGLAIVVATDVLIRRAIARHDPAMARRFILSIPGLEKAGRTLAVTAYDFPTVVQLATLEHKVGDASAGTALSLKILDFLDHGGQVVGIPGGEDWSRATLLAVLGRDDAALTYLEKYVRTSHFAFWERVEINPAFDALRTRPAFQLIEREEHALLREQQQALAVLRTKGEVPARAAAGKGC
jgi:TolB-like protein/Tfp pilus assembly protein PilF